MSRPDLDAIEARTKASTRGPWTVQPDGWTVRSPDVSESTRGDKIASTYGPMFAVESQVDNADFIAHSRGDVPDLVAYARELEARCARAEKLLRWLQWSAIEPNLDPHCPSCYVAKYQRADSANQYGPHKSDCKLVATLAILKQDAAPPMTFGSALAEAERRLGDGAHAQQNEGGTSCEVGDGCTEFGTGPIWEAAFSDADRRAQREPSPVHSTTDAPTATFRAHAEWLLLTTKQRDEVCAILSKEWENLLDVPCATNEERSSAHAIATARDLLIALSE